MRLILCLAAVLALALFAASAPACNYGGGGVVPASALAAPAGCGYGVQAAPVFVPQAAPAVYGVPQATFFQRSFSPVFRQRAFAPVGYGVGAAVAPGGGVININSNNVGRRLRFRR